MPVLGKVGLVNKGVYAAGKTYSALDFVKYNGSTFVALKGVQGITPSDDGTNWAYLAKGVDVAVANSQTITTPGTALDAIQANKNVNGSLAYNIDQQITSLNDSLSNTLANWDTVSVYSGTANIVASYTDYATASCTLDAGTYIVQAYLEVTGAVSNIGYFAKFESTSEILATSTFDRPSGYSPSVSMACPVRITSQTNFTLRCGVNYLGGGTSAGTASGKLRVLKLK